VKGVSVVFWSYTRRFVAAVQCSFPEVCVTFICYTRWCMKQSKDITHASTPNRFILSRSSFQELFHFLEMRRRSVMLPHRFACAYQSAWRIGVAEVVCFVCEGGVRLHSQLTSMMREEQDRIYWRPNNSGCRSPNIVGGWRNSRQSGALDERPIRRVMLTSNRVAYCG